MKIEIDKAPALALAAKEGDLYVDEDGDVNIVVAATHIKGVNEENLVVCCLNGDAAWIRGLADQDRLAGLTRLASGDRITITID